MNEFDSKVMGGIMGHIVGDALGVPVEFVPREVLKKDPVEGMRGYGTWNQPPGTWSDDTSMMLATMDCLQSPSGEIVPSVLMSGFYTWMEYGKYTPYGCAFDVGHTTRTAIWRYKNMGFKCGCDGERDNGNGSLMRMLPLALAGCSEPVVDDISSVTHAHERSKMACRIYCDIVSRVLNGANVFHAIKQAVYGEKIGNPELKHYMRLPNLANILEDEIKSSGYVVDTLEAALWCVVHTSNYKDCVLKAVNLGGDTDTIGAIAGGIAGVMYGFENIPVEWLTTLARSAYLLNIAGKFVEEVEKIWI